MVRIFYYACFVHTVSLIITGCGVQFGSPLLMVVGVGLLIPSSIATVICLAFFFERKILESLSVCDKGQYYGRRLVYCICRWLSCRWCSIVSQVMLHRITT